MDIVPIFTSLGAAKGIVDDISRHRTETKTDSVPGYGSMLKSGVLSAAIGAVADVGLMYATKRKSRRAEGHGRSGSAGGPTNKAGQSGGGHARSLVVLHGSGRPGTPPPPVRRDTSSGAPRRSGKAGSWRRGE